MKNAHKNKKWDMIKRILKRAFCDELVSK